MIEIRRATASDARAVTGLVRQLGYTGNDAQVDDDLRRLQDSEADVVLVAVDDSVLLGVVAVHVVPRLAEGRPLARVTMLAVREERRGHGTGARLLAAAEADAAALGCSIVEVTSHDRYTEAGAGHFYIEAGYFDAAESSTRFIKILDELP